MGVEGIAGEVGEIRVGKGEGERRKEKVGFAWRLYRWGIR